MKKQSLNGLNQLGQKSDKRKVLRRLNQLEKKKKTHTLFGKNWVQKTESDMYLHDNGRVGTTYTDARCKYRKWKHTKRLGKQSYLE